MSVIFLLLTDHINGLIALCAFCLFLVCLLTLGIIAVFRLVSQENPEEYKKIAAFKVNSAMNVIHFRVTLKNKNGDFCKPAKILKKPIESTIPLGYEQYGSIPFDKQSKSYQYCLTDPEIGYFYRLEWEK